MTLKEMENRLCEQLIVLRDTYGCAGIKSEFENEGSDYRDLILLRFLTAKTGLKLNIKLGGVEAFTDLKLALTLHADGIIIPMVESEFALIKSQNMIDDLLGLDNAGFSIFINIETKTAVDNLDAILGRMSPVITGVTIGRSDLSYSYGYKSQQDSEFTNHQVKKIVDKFSDYPNLIVTLGGGISRKTFENEYLKNDIAPRLTYIETRNVILDRQAIYEPRALHYALDFERDYLNYKLEKNRMFMRLDEKRFETLNLRG